MKKLLWALLCLLLSIPSIGSHIVGGEFEIIHQGNYQYRINLIIYFDEINGEPNNKFQDRIINARIFRFADNVTMRDVSIPFLLETHVEFNPQQQCNLDYIKTSRMVYSTVVTMSPDEYNDAAGYYIVWERCCRNYSITNIYSVDSNTNPALAAGQTFYLKFPPVTENGLPYVNSTPRLSPLLDNYACVGKTYTSDFSGVDDDGDQLVYSLVTPLSTHAVVPYPTILPQPYPDVKWVAPKFDLDHIMGGDPDLSISSTGILTVKPLWIGLYAFAIKCEEFRNGIKIGEVRLDYQLYVVDGCRPQRPPVILGKKKQDSDYKYDNTMTVAYDKTVAANERCIKVQVSDVDSNNPENNYEEQVSIQAIPIGFNENISSILPSVTRATLRNGSVVEFDICFKECPYLDKPFLIGLVAFDGGCSLPLSDTLKVLVDMTKITDDDPLIDTDLTPAAETVVNITAKVNESLTFKVKGSDPNEEDALRLSGRGVSFNLSDYGITFPSTAGNSEVESLFNWDIRCDNVNLLTTDQFKFIFTLAASACGSFKIETVEVNVTVTPPDNSPPNLSITSVQPDLPSDDNTLSVLVGEPIAIQLTATDPDNFPTQDFLKLEMTEATGTIEPRGYSFSPMEGKGEITSTFNWTPTCEIFENGIYENEYNFTFRVHDNRCFNMKEDTVAVKIHVKNAEEGEMDFLPPNFVSPNGDGLNDFFAIAKEDEATGELVSILPRDNCIRHFEGIVVYNRWGRLVYQSDNRDFQWYAINEPSGMYYYLLKYSDKEYKGVITLSYVDSERNR
jgi:hypothetical protein